ncbi:MAG TPA: cell division protein FtsZ [Hyphomicrobiaceae bacterium]|jgi:cell division protein FtsZ|nr:cell division protein FtsZ [Hyphomicrobiaceae bacterium]
MKPRIAVIGVGGAGGNAINNMIAAGLSGPEFMVANTDQQALETSSAEKRIQLGSNLTEGLGAGSKPEIGEAAAEESVEEIRSAVRGCNMVFIAAGMGGGTGTGATSVIARVAREFGMLTVAVVTKPFQFEGSRRMRVAEAGIAELRKHVDTLLVIPNQNLFRIATDRTTFAEAFVLADQVLYSGIACIVDLIIKEGLINLDLADVKTVLSGMGTAMMGTGEAAGEQRAVVAAEEAIVNPLLDDTSLKGAKSLLLSITGGRGLTLWEVDEAANRVRQEVDPDANIIVGATFDDALGDKVRVSLVASGMGRAHASAQRNGHEQTWTPRASAPRPAPQDYRQRLTDAIEEGGVRTGPPASAAELRAPGSVYITEGPIQLSPLGHASRDHARADGNEAVDRAPNRAGAHNGHGLAAPADDAWQDGGESGELESETAPPYVYQRQPEQPGPRKSLLRRLTGAALGRRDEAPVTPARPAVVRSGVRGNGERVDLPVFFGRGRR